MKRIRIGNDINISLRVLTAGEARPLKRRNLRLVLRDPKGGESEVGFSVVGNTLGFVFLGREQKHIGRYGVELWENEGEALQAVTDVSEAFVLVQRSDELGGNDTADLRTESIELSLELDDAQACLAALFASERVDDSLNDDVLVLQRGNTVYTTTVAALQGMLKERINEVEQGLTTTQGTIDSAIKSSKSYTDIKVSQAVGDAKGYTDELVSQAVGNAKGYTDEKVSTVANGQLKLSVKDNGNVVLSNANGESKEFMPATPSGDPMHYLYIAAGAIYNDGEDYIRETPWASLVDDADYNAINNLNILGNGVFDKNIIYNDTSYEVYRVNERMNFTQTEYRDKLKVADYGSNGVRIYNDTLVVHRSGHWYMNGLGDLTNEDMRNIIAWGTANIQDSWGRSYAGSSASHYQPRTNMYLYGHALNKMRNGYFYNNNSEVLVFAETESKNTSDSVVGVEANSLNCPCRHVIGYNVKPSTGSLDETAFKIRTASTIRFKGVSLNTNLSGAPILSKKTILRLIKTATPTSAITITLHANLYARIEGEADILEALAAQPFIALVEASV